MLVPSSPQTGACALLAAGSLVFVAIAIEAALWMGAGAAPDFGRRIAATTSYTVLAVLWPLLFAYLVGLEALRQMHSLWFAVVWPPLLLGISVSNAYQPRDGSYHSKASTQMDTNAIAGFCFAVGGVASSSLGKKAAEGTGKILAVAFLLCLAFVMPSPEIPDDDCLAVVVETAQQSVLQFAIGLLLAAILLNLAAAKADVAGKEESPNI